MPIRPLTAKEASAIEYYCDTLSETFNNWAQSCLKAGYSECKGWEGNARRVRTKDTVKAGIEAEKARIGNRTARTLESVDDMYNKAYVLAEATKQPSAMVSAVTGIARLYGMDKDTQGNPDQPLPLTKEQLADLNRKANLALMGNDTQQEAG